MYRLNGSIRIMMPVGICCSAAEVSAPKSGTGQGATRKGVIRLMSSVKRAPN
jgi:hypothetical protein